MYKIMIADDEGIVIESLTHIIKQEYGDSCIIRSAKTGRSVIELAEEFRPHIAFMDIKMPGINGIDAMKEIRKINQSVLFIVMSAYDKFTYAKEAIALGVLDYLTKPTNKSKIIETLEKAMAVIDDKREKRNHDLLTKEKLMTVVPVIESGMIYTILFQEDYLEEARNFKRLLGIQEDHGFILVIQYGDMDAEGDMTNSVGVSVKAHSFYPKLSEIVKEFFDAVVGPIMINQMIAFIPCNQDANIYDERIKIIEKARNLRRKLKKQIDLDFRIGLGSVKPLEELTASYKEAIVAMRQKSGMVAHIKDIPAFLKCEQAQPMEIEKALIHYIKKGDFARVMNEANTYFDWLVESDQGEAIDIQTKVFEMIVHIENETQCMGIQPYSFRYRGEYLKIIMGYKENEKLKAWFLEKASEICRTMIISKEEQSNSIIIKAKRYIDKYYYKGISLDDVSREVDISPYYFSKLFKEETGENFIYYLTTIRIEKAKQLLNNKALSVKEIGIEVGYSDPNYFSRIFKKSVGQTPTEYKERIG
ncbi:MAG TPA: response regulator [Epulopiscium sp.]|nr:response regulator [Candidatus Epulonipiscium sp.]